MSTEKSEAIVIRVADFSESSRVVSLMTRDFGRVSVVAKGARRLKSAFEAALDLLAVCNVVFIRKSSSGLDILTEAQLTQRFTPQFRDPGRFYAGCYLAELLEALTAEYDPHPELYQAAVSVLQRLAEAENPTAALLWFELMVLHENGQLPQFDACVYCGADVANHAEVGFRFLQGGLVCSNCAGEKPAQQISAAALIAVQDLAAAPTPPEHIPLNEAGIAQLRLIIRTSISHVMGKRPKTARFLQF